MTLPWQFDSSVIFRENGDMFILVPIRVTFSLAFDILIRIFKNFLKSLKATAFVGSGSHAGMAAVQGHQILHLLEILRFGSHLLVQYIQGRRVRGALVREGNTATLQHLLWDWMLSVSVCV